MRSQGCSETNDDQLPKGFDHLTKGAGRTLTLREVTHPLRVMGRRKAKDVGLGPRTFVRSTGPP